MAIFSTQNAALNNASTNNNTELGVNLSLTNIPANIKSLLESVGGVIPDGQPDSTRPRYDLLKGQIAQYAGFYLDNSTTPVLKYDATSNCGNDPDFIATATLTVTSPGVDKNKVELKVKIGTVTKTIATYKVKTNDTINIVAAALRADITKGLATHGFYANGSNADIIVKATESSGGNASDFTLSSVITGTVALTINQFTTSIVTTSQPNRSIDKLTFYIMFRAPFKNATYSSFYGDPLSTANTTSWPYMANQLRQASGLNRLNSAGEEVNANGTPILDWTTKAAYDAVTGIHPTDGYSDLQNELFNATAPTPPGEPNYNKIPLYFYRLAQDENTYATYYKKQKYYKLHWPDIYHANDKDFTSKLPESSRKFYERKIRITSPTLTEAQQKTLKYQVIQNDTTGPYINPVATTGTTQKIRIELNYDNLANDEAARTVNSFTLPGCEFIFKENPFQIFARKPDADNIAMRFDIVAGGTDGNKRYLVENYSSDTKYKSSGLTLGAGIDIGAAFGDAYFNACVWEITNITGAFRIRIGQSHAQVTIASEASIRTAVNTVLQAHFSNGPVPTDYTKLMENTILTKMVTSGTGKYTITINTSHTWFEPNNFFISETTAATITDVTQNVGTIPTQYDFPPAFRYSSTATYSTGDLVLFKKDNNSADKVYRALQSTNGNAPTNTTFWSDTTWRSNHKIAVDSLFKIIIKSFDPTLPLTAASLSTALTTAQVPVAQQSNFIQKFKKSFAVRNDYLWVLFRNNYDLIRLFSLAGNNTTPAGIGESYVKHLRATYSYFFLSRYYNNAITTLTSGANPLKTTPNEIEKSVISSIQYNIGNVSSKRTLLIDAINSHDMTKLIAIVEGTWVATNNKRALVKGMIQNSLYIDPNFIQNTVLRKLYHGIK